MSYISIPDGSITYLPPSGTISNVAGTITLGKGDTPVPPPFPPGPMDFWSNEQGLTEFTIPFQLANSSAGVLIQMKASAFNTYRFFHGDDELITRDKIYNVQTSIMSIWVSGDDLVIEEADFRIVSEGGATFGPLVGRINELWDVQDPFFVWKDYRTGTSTPMGPISDTGPAGGTLVATCIKVPYAPNVIDPVNSPDWQLTFGLSIAGGTDIPGFDWQPSEWALGEGWSINGDGNLEYDGSTTNVSFCSLEYSGSMMHFLVDMEVDIEAGGVLTVRAGGGYGYNYFGAYEGPIFAPTPSLTQTILLGGRVAPIIVKLNKVNQYDPNSAFVAGFYRGGPGVIGKPLTISGPPVAGYILMGAAINASLTPTDEAPEPEPDIEPEPEPSPEPEDPAPLDIGGFVETYPFGTVTRNKPTSAASLTYLPSTAGPFVFPAPYNTLAARLTDESDANGAGVYQTGYSYWRSINYHVGDDSLYVFVTCPKSRAGVGPSLIGYNKTTKAVIKHGAIFPSSDSRSNATGEGWFWSATERWILHVVTDTQIQRYNANPFVTLTPAQRTEVIFSIQAQSGYSGHHIKQVSSSDDGNVFAGTLQNASWSAIGFFTFNVATQEFRTYSPVRSGLDECQIDKSGRWLVTKENAIDEGPNQYGNGPGAEDNVMYDLHNPSDPPKILGDLAGAGGHSDLGYGHMVALDNWNNTGGGWVANAARLWPLDSPAPMNKTDSSLLVMRTQIHSDVLSHPCFTNARADIPIAQQCFFNSNAVSTDSIFANELTAHKLDGTFKTLTIAPSMVSMAASGGTDWYGKLPMANTDVTGRYMHWSSNHFSSRIDSFLVEVPLGLLD